MKVKAENTAKMEHLKKDLKIAKVKYKIISKEAADYLKLAQDLASLMSARGFLIDSQIADFDKFINKYKDLHALMGDQPAGSSSHDVGISHDDLPPQ